MQTWWNIIKDSKNYEPKPKAQKSQPASLNNYFGSIKAFKKIGKEKKKKDQKEKQNKRKNSESIQALGINTTNSNRTKGYKKKHTSLIIYYNLSIKDHHFWEYIKPKKNSKI